MHEVWLPICFRVASLDLGQSYDCPNASEATLMHIGKIVLCLTTSKHDIARTTCIFPGMYCITVKYPGYFREQNIQGNLTGMVLHFSLFTWTCWFSRGNLQQLRSWLTAKQLFVPLQWCWNGFVYVLDVLNLGTNRDRSAQVTVAVSSIHASLVDCHPTRDVQVHMPWPMICVVHPKKYVSCSYVVAEWHGSSLPMSYRVVSLALGRSYNYDRPGASLATLRDMG